MVDLLELQKYYSKKPPQSQRFCTTFYDYFPAILKENNGK